VTQSKGRSNKNYKYMVISSLLSIQHGKRSREVRQSLLIINPLRNELVP